jgi:3-methylcrotonyl-CoA carboxylase alpha subunit
MQIGYRSGARHLVVGIHRDAPGRFTVNVDGDEHAVDAALLDPSTIQLQIDGSSQIAHVVRIGGAVHVWIGGEVYLMTPETAGGASEQVVHLQPQVLAPMPGKVLQVLVDAGQSVAAGDGLVIVEAMKMERDRRRAEVCEGTSPARWWTAAPRRAEYPSKLADLEALPVGAC